MTFLNRKKYLLLEKPSLSIIRTCLRRQLVQLNWKKDLLLESQPQGIIGMLLTILMTIEHMLEHVIML